MEGRGISEIFSRKEAYVSLKLTGPRAATY